MEVAIPTQPRPAGEVAIATGAGWQLAMAIARPPRLRSEFPATATFLFTQNLATHSNVLERALIIDTIFTNRLPAHRPVRSVMAIGQTGSTENAAKT